MNDSAWRRGRRACCRWSTLAGLIALQPACTVASDCDAFAAYGLIVSVRQADGTKVCDATVTAHDGAYSEKLFFQQPQCTYTGATERAGTYDLDVMAGSRSKHVAGIVVDADECHVRGEQVLVTLDP